MTLLDIQDADLHFIDILETDFIIAYDNQPPFTINKYTYMMLHPVNLLQRRHKKIY